MQGSDSLAVVYKVRYKVLNTTLSPQALKESPRGKTMLLESDIQNLHTMIPRTIEWEEVSLPTTWNLENIQTPPPVENNEIEQIVESPDGSIILNFTPNRQTIITLNSSRNCF